MVIFILHCSEFLIPVISSDVPIAWVVSGTWLLTGCAVSACVGFLIVSVASFGSSIVFGIDGTLAGEISGFLLQCTLTCLRGLNLEASRQMVLSSLILFASICDPLMYVIM